MERIASFSVDHNVLTPGLYISRRDANVTTYDMRFKKPNTGDLLSNAEMHSCEHIMATLLRNSQHKDAIVYFPPGLSPPPLSIDGEGELTSPLALSP